ncbi:CRP-like cAMP-activated global transcriptional regulator [Paraconexibacter sp. AEG42_29]|uniref:CRP-like cAMP-activated global transcriptional regulator n=1 Tax=Paraconexibacter sp. AEG42_29 TaxID=2997339 RepID=A0AAU7B2R8_9ACTN
MRVRPEEFLLSRLSREDADAVRAAGEEKPFAAGAELITPGVSRRELVVIEHGFVKVARRHGEREVVLSVHGPGELMGEIALLDRRDHAASVTALTAGSALHLMAPAFWGLLSELPHLNRSIIGTVTTRLRDAGNQRGEQLAATAIVRVAGRIMWLAERFGVATEDAVRIDIPLTQAELSSWAGVSRETGVRALRQLRDAGWIRLERRRILVTDTAAVHRFVAADVAAPI